MRTRLVAVVAVFALGLACGRSADEAPSATSPSPRVDQARVTKLSWESSWDSAFRRARSENRVVMVEFYADWCVWCKRMDSTTFANPEVVGLLAASAVPVRLDGEREGRVLAGKYRVEGYPTILFFAPDQRELGRVPGYLDAGDFVQTVRAWLGSASG